jgi:hypothetical protein
MGIAGHSVVGFGPCKVARRAYSGKAAVMGGLFPFGVGWEERSQDPVIRGLLA